ncbi:glycosyltransferase family 39 protein [Candidatus Shapirobacteria bacterium]|nr:glycosyltransferase family 39 protein [Candidatus Shapirobacteria bacterium]
MKPNHKLLFWTILLLAAFFRLWKLDTMPSGLNWDEISHGYNAYSVLETGRDQWGTSLPIFNFRAYGDYPTTLNLYLTIPFIKLLGLNALSIRIPTVIFSLLFVIYTYRFAQLLFKKIPPSLIAMSLAAFLPWAFFPSRGVFQSTFSQTLLLMGIYHFLIDKNRSKHLLLSSIFFGLSMYAYHNARIIVPLLLPTLYFFHPIKLSKKILPAIIVLLILVIPNVINLISPSSFARNRWVGIINPNAVNLINLKRNSFTGPQIINRLINNRPVYFVQTLSLNYLNQLNPFPLFLNGTENQQLSVPQTGILFLILMPFLYAGLIFSLNDGRYFYLLPLLFITLLPAALTVGDFPVLRSSTALIFYILFITIGISLLKIDYRITILTIFVFFIFYWTKYTNYSQKYSYAWQYGYSQAVEIAKENYSKYDHIVITKKYGEPHEFFLFYWPWPPQKYQKDPLLSTNFHSDWYWVDAYDKFEFKNDWEIKELNFSPKTLLITSPKNYPSNGAKQLKTIDFLDSSPAFDIISYD